MAVLQKTGARKSEGGWQSASAAKSSDRTALLAALDEKYLATVYAYCLRRTATVAEAEDVTAETFAAAYATKSFPDRLFQNSGDDPLKAWLLGIARRKVADGWRARQRRRESPMEDAAHLTTSTVPPEAESIAREAASELRQMLNKLPSDQHEAMLLCYADELSHDEIATVLRRSPAAVNSLLQRARAALRKMGSRYFTEETEP